jgi:hypothetical protein
MKDKFIKDFFDAHAIDKAITTGEIDIVAGVRILKELVIYVRKDVATLDNAAKVKLEEVIKQLDLANEKSKNKIGDVYPAPEDSEEENILKYKKLKEDHKRYRNELFYIQDVAYNKGWFDQDKHN